MRSYITVLVFFAVFLASCYSNEDKYKDNDAAVLILGAGAAGLQAASTLYQSGFVDFIIVEGADRVGGRVRNTQFAGMNVEVGAVLASPATSKTVEIVKKLGLNGTVSDYESYTVRNDTGGDVTAYYDADYERFEPAYEKLRELRGKLQENDDIPDMSQRSALKIGGWNPRTPTEKIVEWFDFDFEYGNPPDISTTRNSEDFGEGIFMTDSGGLKQIFGDVAGFLEEPKFINHTRLNQNVVKITEEADRVQVECRDGTVYSADYVLVTFSLGVLQSKWDMFDPSLPEWKDVEIQKAQMAAFTQIYISFGTKFWDDTEWILHASDRRGYYPAFMNLQSPGIYPSGTPTLLAFVTGDEARRVESQPTSETQAEIVQVLRGMYGSPIPQPTGILVSDWYTNPLTRGSFSNLGVEVPDKCREKLQSRVGRVFFGGEGTSEHYNGYVDGGFDSGNREANKILDCMALEDFNDCPIAEVTSLECDKPTTAGAGSFYFNMYALLVGLGVCLYWFE